MKHPDDPFLADKLGMDKISVYALLDKGLICRVEEDMAGTVTFRATPRLINYKSDGKERRRIWWSDNWIALLSLLVSIIALISSWR